MLKVRIHEYSGILGQGLKAATTSFLPLFGDQKHGQDMLPQLTIHPFTLQVSRLFPGMTQFLLDISALIHQNSS